MMPEPIVFPRVTAIPKVTPRIRSMLRFEGAGSAFAAVNAASPFRMRKTQFSIVERKTWRRRITNKCFTCLGDIAPLPHSAYVKIPWENWHPYHRNLLSPR